MNENTRTSNVEEMLPSFLKESIDKFVEGKMKSEADKSYMQFDCDYCELQSDINVAEVEGIISSEEAWNLRKKYLGINKGTID
ncbi:MAG: hypothetical protein E7242_01130 [Lachnospiraceae bacterium]|nr:hypothetical protein [Lachnospiraceae bacterium]